MTTEKTIKKHKNFGCEICYFNTCKKQDFDRHILTKKHKNNVLTTDDNQKNSFKKYICDGCEKEYNDRAGLWRHKKNCNIQKENTYKNEKIDDHLISMLVNQCKELRDENKELIEIIKNGTHNTNSYNTNSHNKTFNLQFFLNETCKDAMNITDFINSIQLQLSDLEKVGKIGYVEGISNIITTNLKALDVTQRPIHCTDNKRETLYVKNENKWEKENEEKNKLRKVIKHIAQKNSKLIPEFKNKYPDCIKSDSKYSDQYNKLVVESFGGQGDNDNEKENKIIKNIAKEVVIEK